jgi:hypothetical protein
MISVYDPENRQLDFPTAKWYTTDEHGWISILDEDVLAVAVLHKDHVYWVEIKNEAA